MVAGRFFVEAIDLIIDSDLHKLNRDRDDRAVAATEGFLGEFGIDPSSRRLAHALRSIRTMDKEKASDFDKAEAFKKLVPTMIGQSTERVLVLIEKLEMTVGRIDKDLFAERTRLSTISTVIRPLSTKWLERWNSQDRPDFNFEKAIGDANELLNEEIESTDALESWLGRVFQLFTDLVVFRGSSKSLVSRPAGMVSESNERVYRRNWFAFIGEHLNDLMSKANQIASGDSKSAYSSSYSTWSTGKVFSTVRDHLITSAESAAQPTSANLRIEIKIESAIDATASASRIWSSKTQILDEVSEWITAISGIWGEPGREISVSIEITAVSGTSSIAIPNKSPDAAAEAVKSFVKASV